MGLNDVLKALYQDIHTVAIASIDKCGKPFAAFMDVMKADESGIYFCTNDQKKLYWCLNNTKDLTIVGMNGTDYFHSAMIHIDGKVENIGKDMIDELFDKNDYMRKLYPRGSDYHHIDVFRLYDIHGDYQDFSVIPPVKKEF